VNDDASRSGGAEPVKSDEDERDDDPVIAATSIDRGEDDVIDEEAEESKKRPVKEEVAAAASVDARRQREKAEEEDALAKKKQEEETRKQAKIAVAKKKREEDEAEAQRLKKKREEEEEIAAAKKKREDDAKKQAEIAAAKKKREEDEAEALALKKKKELEEAEELAAKKKREDDAKKQAEIAAAKKKREDDEAEALRLKKKKEQEEAEELAAKKKREEDEAAIAKKKQQQQDEEEAARKKKREEEEVIAGASIKKKSDEEKEEEVEAASEKGRADGDKREDSKVATEISAPSQASKQEMKEDASMKGMGKAKSGAVEADDDDDGDEAMEDNRAESELIDGEGVEKDEDIKDAEDIQDSDGGGEDDDDDDEGKKEKSPEKRTKPMSDVIICYDDMPGSMLERPKADPQAMAKMLSSMMARPDQVRSMQPPDAAERAATQDATQSSDIVVIELPDIKQGDDDLKDTKKKTRRLKKIAEAEATSAKGKSKRSRFIDAEASVEDDDEGGRGGGGEEADASVLLPEGEHPSDFIVRNGKKRSFVVSSSSDDDGVYESDATDPLARLDRIERKRLRDEDATVENGDYYDDPNRKERWQEKTAEAKTSKKKGKKEEKNKSSSISEKKEDKSKGNASPSEKTNHRATKKPCIQKEPSPKSATPTPITASSPSHQHAETHDASATAPAVSSPIDFPCPISRTDFDNIIKTVGWFEVLKHMNGDNRNAADIIFKKWEEEDKMFRKDVARMLASFRAINKHLRYIVELYAVRDTGSAQSSNGTANNGGSGGSIRQLLMMALSAKDIEVRIPRGDCNDDCAVEVANAAITMPPSSVATVTIYPKDPQKAKAPTANQKPWTYVLPKFVAALMYHMYYTAKIDSTLVSASFIRDWTIKNGDFVTGHSKFPDDLIADNTADVSRLWDMWVASNKIICGFCFSKPSIQAARSPSPALTASAAKGPVAARVASPQPSSTPQVNGTGSSASHNQQQKQPPGRKQAPPKAHISSKKSTSKV
jgi:hypothetical protein